MRPSALDELWEKSNDAFGDFVPGIRGNVVYLKRASCINRRARNLRHVARYAAVVLLGSAVGLTAAFWNNWRSHPEVNDFPIMVPGGGANVANGYVIRLPVNQMLVMPAGI